MRSIPVFLFGASFNNFNRFQKASAIIKVSVGFNSKIRQNLYSSVLFDRVDIPKYSRIRPNFYIRNSIFLHCWYKKRELILSKQI